MLKKQAKILIKGRVQGVFFRSFLKKQAQKLSLKGWVKNLNNNQVEVLFQGKKEAIEKAIEGCRQGPPAAQVKSIKVSWQKPKEEFTDFEIVW